MPNVTLPTPAPVQHFARCIDADNRPESYIGDWPIAGCVYEIRVLPHVATGKPHVHVMGFHAERPYGAFAPHRFVPVAEVWLN